MKCEIKIKEILLPELDYFIMRKILQEHILDV